MATEDKGPQGMPDPLDREQLKTIRLTEEEKRAFMDQALTKKAEDQQEDAG